MSPVPLRREPPALPAAFVVVRTAAWLGIAVTVVTVPVVVYARSGSALVAGVAAALEVAPYLLVGLWAGATADRRPPVGVLRGGAATSSLVLTATAIGVALVPHDAGTVLLLAGAAGVVALSAFGDAAGFALLPRLVPRERLARANGRLAVLGLAVQTAGPVLAGGLLALGAGAWALLLHAGLLLVVVAVAPRVRPTEDGPPAVRPAPGAAVTVGDGVRFVRRHPVVGPLTLAGACTSITTGGVLGVLAVYGHEVLDWPLDGARVALLYAAVSVGGLLAGLLAPRLVHRHGPAWVGVVGLGLSGAGLALLVLLPGPAISPVALGLWQTAVAAVVLNGIVVRQLVTPLTLQGRVGVTGRMIAWGTQPIGALVAGAAAQAWGAQVAIAVVTGGSLLAIATLLRAERGTRALREPVPSVASEPPADEAETLMRLIPT